MAFETTINSSSIRFCRLRKSKDVDETVEFVRSKSEPGGVVVFIDLYPNEHLVRVVEILRDEGFVPVVIDHHDLQEDPIDEFERALRRESLNLRRLLTKGNARITTRKEAACCLQMISFGEFEKAVIVAYPGADGAASALYASGVSYAEMPSDAAILDGPPERRLNASLLGLLLLKTVPAAADAYERGQVFSLWAEAIQGNSSAREELESRLPRWEKAAKSSKKLAGKATEVVPKVLLANCVPKPYYDSSTLARGLAERGCVLNVLRQKHYGGVCAVLGPIAYTMHAVALEHGRINVRKFLEPGYDPSGIIVQGNFRLSVSEERWQDFLLPALQARFRR